MASYAEQTFEFMKLALEQPKDALVNLEVPVGRDSTLASPAPAAAILLQIFSSIAAIELTDPGLRKPSRRVGYIIFQGLLGNILYFFKMEFSSFAKSLCK